MKQGSTSSSSAPLPAASHSTLLEAVASDYRSLLGIAVELSGLIVLVAAILLFGNWHFGGFDQSVVIGAGYRFCEGQQPYRDFVMTVPVLFYVGAALACSLCGVSWFALIIATGIYAAATYSAISWALRQLGLRHRWAIAIAFTAESLSMVLAAYWWYNPITSITVASFLVLSVVVLQKPNHYAAWALWTLITAILGLAKPNSAGLMLVISAIGFLLRPSVRKKYLICSCGALAIDLSLLFAFRLDPREVFHSYLGAAGRGYPSWERFVQDTPPEMVGLALLLIGLTLMPWAFAGMDRFTSLAFGHLTTPHRDDLGRLRVSEWVLFIGGAAVAFLAFFTNGELKAVDLPMLFLPVALSTLMSAHSGSARKLYLAFLMIFLSLTGFVLGAQRSRVRLIGPGAFYQLPAWGGFSEYSPFFAHLKEGYNLHAVMAAVSELVTHLNAALGSRPKVFFGPRMEFNYAAYRLDSPRGLPLFWHEGVGYPADLRHQVAAAFRDADFDVCVFLRGDFTHVPVEILSHLESTYQRMDTHALTIFYRRADLIPTGFDPGPRPVPAHLHKAFSS